MRINPGVTLATLAAATCAALSVALAPVAADARGGGGGGFGHGAGFVGHGHAPMFRPGLSHFAPGRHFDHHFAHGFPGFWGWGSTAFWPDSYPSLSGPDAGGITPYRDVPLVDFYNPGFYSGGPYGMPLGYSGYPAGLTSYGSADGPALVPTRRGCEAENQAVPNGRSGLSHVTIVRC